MAAHKDGAVQGNGLRARFSFFVDPHDPLVEFATPTTDLACQAIRRRLSTTAPRPPIWCFRTRHNTWGPASSPRCSPQHRQPRRLADVLHHSSRRLATDPGPQPGRRRKRHLAALSESGSRSGDRGLRRRPQPRTRARIGLRYPSPDDPLCPADWGRPDRPGGVRRTRRVVHSQAPSRSVHTLFGFSEPPPAGRADTRAGALRAAWLLHLAATRHRSVAAGRGRFGHPAVVAAADLARRARLDQRAFAERVGLSKSAFGRLERGDTSSLTIETLVDLIEAGGCTLRVLDADDRPLRHTLDDHAWIDRAGRRTPAHLDVYSTYFMGSWWATSRWTGPGGSGVPGGRSNGGDRPLGRRPSPRTLTE